jgi:hypothetical protein
MTITFWPHSEGGKKGTNRLLSAVNSHYWLGVGAAHLGKIVAFCSGTRDTGHTDLIRCIHARRCSESATKQQDSQLAQVPKDTSAGYDGRWSVSSPARRQKLLPFPLICRCKGLLGHLWPLKFSDTLKFSDPYLVTMIKDH